MAIEENVTFHKQVMSVLQIVSWICSSEITRYAVVVFLYTIIILIIFSKAVNQKSKNVSRRKVTIEDITITNHDDMSIDPSKAQEQCLQILQEWRKGVSKQVEILSRRLEEKHHLIRQHCRIIINILKEELQSTEAQLKIIGQHDIIDSVLDSDFVDAQLSTVWVLIDGLETTLARFRNTTIDLEKKKS